MFPREEYSERRISIANGFTAGLFEEARKSISGHGLKYRFPLPWRGVIGGYEAGERSAKEAEEEEEGGRGSGDIEPGGRSCIHVEAKEVQGTTKRRKKKDRAQREG